MEELLQDTIIQLLGIIIGGILAILESRWVFLLFIILPILFIFLYELYEFVLEVKKSLKEV